MDAKDFLSENLARTFDVLAKTLVAMWLLRVENTDTTTKFIFLSKTAKKNHR